MGGFFGAVSDESVVLDVFFGTDYHSHLGTRNAGLGYWDADEGFNRQIHSIANISFRARFEDDLGGFSGTCGIGCISDTDPQPLLVRSHLGLYCIATVGIVNNAEELVADCFERHGQQFMAMSSGKVNCTELVAALINQKDNLVDGIRYAQDAIDGSMNIVIMGGAGSVSADRIAPLRTGGDAVGEASQAGEGDAAVPGADDLPGAGPFIIAARDKVGRLPVVVGKGAHGHCVSFESFACNKLDYEPCHELGPGEIVRLLPGRFDVLAPAGGTLRICAFLWTYYGYPNSNYEGVNVECMRCGNGRIMARDEQRAGTLPAVDSVAGMPDSGVPHAIGYANESGIPFTRPFVKYTPTWPRSFMPNNQEERNRIAKMKQVPVPELIEGKRLLMVDDSIVRGTQLRETVDFLTSNGAREVHMRSACPPIMFSCKFLNFSRGNSDMDLLARRIVQELEGDEGQRHLDEYADGSTARGRALLTRICETFGFDSLGYQSMEGLVEAIGLPEDCLCTYCWNGRE